MPLADRFASQQRENTRPTALPDTTGRSIEIITTDANRAELYGDLHIQGNWTEIEGLLHEPLCSINAAAIPVFVGPTHVSRPR